MDAIGLICLGFGVLGVLAHFLPSRSQLWIVFSTGALYLMLFTVPAVVVFGASGRYVELAAAVITAAVAAYSQAPLYRRRSPTEAGTAVTVLTSNLLFGRGSAAALAALVSDHQVDVLMVQEITHRQCEALQAAGIERQLPYRFARPGSRGEGTALWSRFPLSHTQSEPGFGFELLSARASLPTGQQAWLLAVHLEPPWPRRPTAWSRELPLLGQRLTELAAEPAACVIVAGDFNATWDHAQFRRLLTNGYREAAVQASRWPVLTWDESRPWPVLLGIDHILLRSAIARSVRSFPVTGSDHRAVLAEIVLGASNRPD